MSKKKSKKSRWRRNASISRKGDSKSTVSKKRGQENRTRFQIWQKGLSIIGGVAVTASIISLLLSFLPQITVRSEGSLDPQNPFSTPFVITNSGLTGINEVTFLCRLRHAINNNGGKIIAYEKGVRPIGFKITQIVPGESATVGLPFTWIGGTTASADFDFVLEYRPSYYPLMRQATFRFATARQQDGTLVWLPRAQAEQ